MVYTLTEDDYTTIQELSRLRADGKRGVAYRGSSGPQSKQEIHEAGLRGEVAFGRVFGLEVDKEKRAHGDDVDFAFDNGLTVDVKHRGDSGKDLAMKGDDVSELVADVAVLTWDEGRDRVRVVGWTTPVRLLVDGNCSRWSGVGVKLWISYQDLWDIERLPTKTPVLG